MPPDNVYLGTVFACCQPLACFLLGRCWHVSCIGLVGMLLAPIYSQRYWHDACIIWGDLLACYYHAIMLGYVRIIGAWVMLSSVSHWMCVCVACVILTLRYTCDRHLFHSISFHSTYLISLISFASMHHMLPHTGIIHALKQVSTP